MGIVAVVALRSGGDEERERRRPPDRRQKKERAPPPRSRPREAVQEQTPPADCVAVADGGFSCGACRDDSNCPPKQACFLNVATGRTECRDRSVSRTVTAHPTSCAARFRERCAGTQCADAFPLGTRAEGTACNPDNGGDPSVSCAGKHALYQRRLRARVRAARLPRAEQLSRRAPLRDDHGRLGLHAGLQGGAAGDRERILAPTERSASSSR